MTGVGWLLWAGVHGERSKNNANFFKMLATGSQNTAAAGMRREEEDK